MSEQIIQRLQAQGIRLTIQRRLVIEALYEHQGHLHIQDIQEFLRQRGIEVNETTVYRVLQWLKEQGIVAQTDLGQSGIIYQIVDDEPHHHLVCLSCGMVMDIDNELFTQLSEQLRHEYGFEPRIDHMAIFGQCKYCQG
jgi:Fur family ferric uptake transcriptional regulator